MNEFNKIYSKIVRPLATDVNSPSCFHSVKTTIGDVILESVLPSPFRLVDDIISKLKNVDEVIYRKEDIIRLSDASWRFYDNLKRTPDGFELTVFRSDRYEYRRRHGSFPNSSVRMMEVVDPNDFLKESIWINNEDEENYEYDDSFKNMLKHELGHVWTFLFGALDESFTDGQTTSNDASLDVREFTQYQLDVLLHLYNGDLKLLKNDFRYMFKKNDDDSANFELSTNIDNIIEILIADYFESGMKSTSAYLSTIWKKLELDYDFSLDTLNLLKHYKSNELYEGFSSIKHIKTFIRRLFLLFAFGDLQQIDYFKKACIEEFGGI